VEFDVSIWLFVVAFGGALASLVSSLARIQSVSSSGLTLRTVLGVKHLAWTEIEAPGLYRPGPFLLHLIVRPKTRSFFSIRTQYGVVGPLREAERLATALSSFIAVKEGTVYSAKA